VKIAIEEYFRLKRNDIPSLIAAKSAEISKVLESIKSKVNE
jgi:hypothetical protein